MSEKQRRLYAYELRPSRSDPPAGCSTAYLRRDAVQMRTNDVVSRSYRNSPHFTPASGVASAPRETPALGALKRSRSPRLHSRLGNGLSRIAVCGVSSWEVM